MVMVTIDRRPVEVPAGTTILAAAAAAGVRIPTLCHFQGHDPLGACRVCLVEVEGARTLVASCAMPAAEGMKIHTATKRVRDARRTVLELLLSDHTGDCPTCVRSEDCELQALARAFGIRDRRYGGTRSEPHFDDSTPALQRDSGKCILCRRCVTACNEIQAVGALFPQNRGFDTFVGPAFACELDAVTCVQCGQCAAVCPVGAIVERDQIGEVWAALDDPERHVVVQTAPAIRAALGECFGLPPGSRVTGRMTAALRRLGFDAVFDTNVTADLTFLEEGTELLRRLKRALVPGRRDAGGRREPRKVALPMFTSCSPGWINYAEHFWPQLLPNLSTCRSPQQMFGAMAKTYYADKLGKRPEDIFVVSIAACTAKKFEAARPEMQSSGGRDVDVVLTTRELGRMIKQAGIDFVSLPDEEMDAPLGSSTGAADIFANTGGVMEASLRTAWEIATGAELPFEGLHVTPIASLEGVKEASATIAGTKREWSFLEGVTLKVAVVHGLDNARKVMERVAAGTADYHLVEIMTCPGGCIGGGGQPRFTDDDVRRKRIAAIDAEDEDRPLRKSRDNPAVMKLYEELRKAPLGEKSRHPLHTRSFGRERV